MTLVACSDNGVPMVVLEIKGAEVFGVVIRREGWARGRRRSACIAQVCTEIFRRIKVFNLQHDH